MTDPRPALGLKGEEVAGRHLERLGYRILERRFRCRAGEIDLIAQDGQTIVFVEVRTRRTRSFGTPEESVTAGKQRRLGRLAAGYLGTRGLTDRDCRFDVVAVEIGPDGAPSVRHLPDAFRL